MSQLAEEARLNILRSYLILDTAAERAFDNLTELAAAICEVPISLITFVDANRQWFKSRVGIEVNETPREHAFCAYAIHQDGLTVVEDARTDARFRDNPLVTGGPQIRFYAGAPLKMASGAQIGTLCVFDNQPHTLSDVQRKTLSVLRDAVVTQLELRQALHDFQSLQMKRPVCAWCHRVQVDEKAGADGRWVSLYDYTMSHQLVSHGICPECSSRQDSNA